MNQRNISVLFPCLTLICVIFLENAETKGKQKEKHKKTTWFKDTFLDSKRKLKEEIHKELKRYV